MQNEDEAPLTLSKWPFYLGDALLVATALAIAVLGEWNLSDWQVLSCVLAVALGAGLLCLPFAFEHWLRVSEVNDDRLARLRLLERRQKELTEACIELRDECDERRAQAARLESASDALAEAVDRRLAGVQEDASAAAEAALSGLRDRLAAQEKRSENTEPSLSELRDRLAAQEKRSGKAAVEIGELGEALSRMEARMEAFRNEAEARAEGEASAPPSEPAASEPPSEPEASAPPSEPAASEPPPEPEASAPPPEPEARSARPRRHPGKPEPRLLHRAIKDKPERASSAVSRIIGSKEDRTKKSDTVLTVNCLIGIGNKPYIRGSGGGLDWEKGLPLEFESIGIWRWVAPEDLDGPISFLLFRNDEDPDRTGKHELAPGDKLEIEPRF